jgi:hypothetical protein
VGLNLDIRQLVLQKDSALAAHESQNRPRPHEIAENYIIDERVTSPNPITIGVFDDLLTTRSHFKAMKSVLLERFPGARITGVFLARRVPETDDPIES